MRMIASVTRSKVSCLSALSSLLLATVPALASGVIVYPAKGQSAEQQKKDQGECLSWASQQTGFDPTAPLQATTPPPVTAAPTTRPAKGMFRGALLGTTVGAIAGDTGKGAAIGAASGALVGGMRRRDQVARETQQQAGWADEQAAGYAQQQSDFNRSYAACLTGRGYTVN